jgi:hypothetical protein
VLRKLTYCVAPGICGASVDPEILPKLTIPIAPSRGLARVVLPTWTPHRSDCIAFSYFNPPAKNLTFPDIRRRRIHSRPRAHARVVVAKLKSWGRLNIAIYALGGFMLFALAVDFFAAPV